MRRALMDQLKKAGYDVHDDGDQKLDPLDDYPVFAQRVVKDILSSKDPDVKGILICGSGQGICIAANRYKGIRAALIYDTKSAISARNDDDSNVACLPADILEADKAITIVKTFFETPFAAAPRFIRRIKEMDDIE